MQNVSVLTFFRSKIFKRLVECGHYLDLVLTKVINCNNKLVVTKSTFANFLFIRCKYVHLNCQTRCLICIQIHKYLVHIFFSTIIAILLSTKVNRHSFFFKSWTVSLKIQLILTKVIETLWQYVTKMYMESIYITGS